MQYQGAKLNTTSGLIDLELKKVDREMNSFIMQLALSSSIKSVEDI